MGSDADDIVFAINELADAVKSAHRDMGEFQEKLLNMLQDHEGWLYEVKTRLMNEGTKGQGARSHCLRVECVDVLLHRLWKQVLWMITSKGEPRTLAHDRGAINDTTVRDIVDCDHNLNAIWKT